MIVGVDDWRIHNVDEYTFASRLRFDDTFTVWRNQRYQQLRVRVPQRWLSTYFRQYLGPQRCARRTRARSHPACRIPVLDTDAGEAYS